MRRQELQIEFVLRKYPPPRVHLRRLPVDFIGYPCHRKIQAWCHKYCGGSLKKEEMPILIQSSRLTNLGSFYTRDSLPRFDSVDSANQSVKWVFAEPADETLVDGAIAFPTSGCGSLMQRTVIPFVPQKEQDDIEKGSNIHTIALFSKTSTKNSGIQCADPFRFRCLGHPPYYKNSSLKSLLSHPKS